MPNSKGFSEYYFFILEDFFKEKLLEIMSFLNLFEILKRKITSMT